MITLATTVKEIKRERARERENPPKSQKPRKRSNDQNQGNNQTYLLRNTRHPFLDRTHTHTQTKKQTNKSSS